MASSTPASASAVPACLRRAPIVAGLTVWVLLRAVVSTHDLPGKSCPLANDPKPGRSLLGLHEEDEAAVLASARHVEAAHQNLAAERLAAAVGRIQRQLVELPVS